MRLRCCWCWRPRRPRRTRSSWGGCIPCRDARKTSGSECKLGAEQAVEEINAKGGVLGKKFELLSADDKANVQESVNLSKRYIQKDGVDFLFGVGQLRRGARGGRGGQAGEGHHDDHRRLHRRRDEGQVEPVHLPLRDGQFPGGELPGPLHGEEVPETDEVLQHRPGLRVRPDDVGAVQDEDEGTEPEGGVHRGAVAEARHSRLHLLHQRHPAGQARRGVLLASGAATSSRSSSRRSRTACSTR